MKINELRPRIGDADVEGVVTAIQPARLFNKFGKEGRVANARIQDDTGTITLTLWNEQVDQVKVGDTLKITKGWVSEWQGEMQLSTGKFGTLEIVSQAPEGDEEDIPAKPARKNDDPRPLEPDESKEEEDVE